MPRKARVKEPEAVYHIMCRSVSEFMLFRDNDDKDYYLELLKRYTDKYRCKVYAYCLMDNHLHLQLDTMGFDVSKFMHSTNTAYVRYYNIKYKRHGHVFQDRFESRVLDTDEYNLSVSAYIHNNPHDIEEYKGREEKYKYSSYGIYLGIRKDLHGLVEKSFTIGLFNTNDAKKFTEKYLSFVNHQRDIGSLTELKKKLACSPQYEYISGRKVIVRDQKPSQVVSYISGKLMIADKSLRSMKNHRKVMEFRAITAYALRVLCGLGYKEICGSLYNITISGCARLCRRGYELIKDENQIYRGIFDELVSSYS